MKKETYLSFSLFMLCLIVVRFASAQNPTAEWQKSKHADRELPANDVAAWETRNLETMHCGRCHTEQGFKAWVSQLMKGDPSDIKKPDGKEADEAFVKALGLTKDHVKPITCVTRHSQGSQLRITDNIPLLPNGVSVRGAGKGALCMACHNARNGRIAWDSSDPKGYGQPHNAAQTDVILGKNVFFYNDIKDTESPHAVGDVCVTCHKTLSAGGHTFKPSTCDTCHGERVKEAFVQNGIVDLQKQLTAGIAKRVMAAKEKIACVTSWDPRKDQQAPNTAIDGRQIRAVEIPPGIHGQISLKFILEDGKEIYSQMGNIKDACGDQGKPVYATSDPVVRALWNYLLFEYDGSKGVHNPRFARNVLIATTDAISK